MNSLEHESSPYLLQHAANPVHWHPWGEEVLEKAQAEDKLLIVSIGYSSCHWCHVMEHESFEDEEVAARMNQHFICIKIDREERPDIDQVYMTAVQMMGQQGGWPLNCIALPDGRPVWGGTYFPKDQWMSILEQVHNYYVENRHAALGVAERLAAGIRQASLVVPSGENQLPGMEEIRESVDRWSDKFDHEEGGFGHAPKFPTPPNLAFLLHLAYLDKNSGLLGFVETTLLKMARGGICDQAGGGFARYSVDRFWKVPHFEKMLYDNGQLLNLYAEAFQVFGRDEFKEVLLQTVDFLKREMRSPEGLFYSALDADSEGVEGKFYTWTRDELETLLAGDFDLFAEYYQVGEQGLWEDGRYILIRREFHEAFARERGMEPALLEARIRDWQRQLLAAREKRIRPGLDNKALCSWNSLAISGLMKVHRATGDIAAMELALETASSVTRLLRNSEGKLFRNFAGGQASIPAFHVDYALFIQACLDLHELGMEEQWLERARALTAAAGELFWDEHVGMYLFNPRNTEVLISAQVESQDNVMPSSNSVMAHNLFRLGHLLGENGLLERSAQMLAAMRERLLQYPNGFANWGRLALMHHHPFHEIVVSGPDAGTMLRELATDYLPQALLAGSEMESKLPLFQGRFRKDKTHIFVCRNRSCELPVENKEDARKLYQR